MHSQCRICGPWFFYIILFILYELPILILAIFAIVQYGIDKQTREEWSARLRRVVPGETDSTQHQKISSG